MNIHTPENIYTMRLRADWMFTCVTDSIRYTREITRRDGNSMKYFNSWRNILINHGNDN